MVINEKALHRGVALMVAGLVSLMAMFGGTPAFAEDHVEDQYIRFVSSGNERMNSDGSFEFYFHDRLTSDSFTANGTTITISTDAEMFAATGANAHYFRDSSYIYKVTLYKDALIDKEIGSYQACGDGVAVSERFLNIEKGAKYYFVLTVEKPSDLYLSVYYFDGTGTVSNVTVI